ncbi:4Fe-4S dicluster domain-containing protein [Anaerocolumna jejuensis DSM 15929]|uniref:4Fe-4S dicluster domain-containing protein n=1 Tax=Anaerocolumna jejuensis DSM 15929 TaxID=1121322 RepID=A0A1M7DFK2_9FIRM|nr:4Fe-4S binding protein [Anaerocolumna jejuensis]SHL78301.1 4Fe-4S dicluster domain-containing protein [Anaerocolumna jejuensis DSM 15929]
MIRKIIKIDKEACNGCGLCVNACHEGAIGLIDNKAVLLRDDYCDGLGNCLPVCPTGAITFEEREALEYNEEEVLRMQKKAEESKVPDKPFTGCPGSQARSLRPAAPAAVAPDTDTKASSASESVSRLMQWPVQIKLVPVNAPYFNGADLLIAADCTAYAYADFHEEFMKNRITVIGCPKLDDVDYSEKLTQIFLQNDIKSITVVRMIVPCCGGIVNAVKAAMLASGKIIPWQVITVSTDGTLIN